MKAWLAVVVSAGILGGLFFFLLASSREVLVTAETGNVPASAPSDSPQGAAVPETSAQSQKPVPVSGSDLPNQARLPNPPQVVKAIYATSWSAGSPDRVASLIDLVKRTELNALVVDIKDYSGYAAYRMNVPEVQASGALEQLRIIRPNELIGRLHAEGIYVIARISVFQDPILARAHPEWAVRDSQTGKPWADRKGLSWMDPAAKPVWDYNIAIARDAASRGFDEINFDYIRFPSDGDLKTAVYPFWDDRTPQSATMREFFSYMRNELPGVVISADLFGLTTVNPDDLGIGQIIEDAYANFDYVSPMVYPSHYAPGFLGYKNPASYPYEVVKYSMERARARLEGTAIAAPTSTATSSTSAEPSGPAFSAKLRPWLQDFNLGTIYDGEMVEQQIRAVTEALGGGDQFAGWLLWDPANKYVGFQDR
ncbi:hypothetical protein C4587_01175 [Candidatus Parcubacteria bacterium]|nr:MAG: hypothetical protein C4587_01175 [Candidatus Parcubacteria bacterium]